MSALSIWNALPNAGRWPRMHADPAVQRLHQQLAEFHEAEAKRQLTELVANEDQI